MSEYHIPVLLAESVSALITNPDGTYADATFGGGGHTAAVLSRLNDGARVIAFDRDIDAIKGALQDPRLTLVHNNFRFIENYARYEGVQFDGILADLGVSSHQFDTAERGFSFRFEDSPLDMRMNQEARLDAAEVVNTYPEEDLERILRLYGEVDGARNMARLIVQARGVSPIRTTGQLDQAIGRMLPRTGRRLPEPPPRRPAGSYHLPQPGRPDGEELHQDRKRGRRDGSGPVWPDSGSYGGREPETHPPQRGRNCRKHPRPQREAPDSTEEGRRMTPGEMLKRLKKWMKSFRNGEFLLKIGADKFYMHIMYLFLLMWLSILLSLKVDKTLSRVGDNKTAIDELRINHAQKEAQLVKLHSASAAEKRLRELGSPVTMPQEPATIVKRK